MDVATPVTGFTREDRVLALERLQDFIGSRFETEDIAAFQYFWGEHLDADEPEDEEVQRSLEEGSDMWFAFDHRLPSGLTPAESLLKSQHVLSPGQRRYLELASGTSLRPYRVTDVVPVASITLEDLFDGAELVVRERMASRTVMPGDYLGARVLPQGAEGAPELEMGIFLFPPEIFPDFLEELKAEKAELREEHPDWSELELNKRIGPTYLDGFMAWYDRTPPTLENTDGEPLLMSKSFFKMLDRERVVAALEGSTEFERNPDAADEWTCSDGTRETLLGRVTVSDRQLLLETNSRERDQRGRALLESLAAGALEFLSTQTLDPNELLAQRLAERDEEEVDEDTSELRSDEVDALILEQYDRHYRAWIDEPIPALDGRTPREASRSEEGRIKVIGMVRDLELAYRRALLEGQPAYDPRWMWDELRLR